MLVPPVPGAIPVIDTSSNNEDDAHRIDWPTLAAHLLTIHAEAAAIVKVSELDYVNPYLHRQRWGAHAAGLKNVGLYFFDRIGESGAQNADRFIAAVGQDGALVAGEFCAADFEDTGAPARSDLDAHVLDALGRIARPLGIAPLCYTGAWYASPHNLNRDPALAQYPLWWAAYQSGLPTVPEPWASQGKGIALWQFTSSEQLPGMPWPCDVSWWLAGIPALRAIQWGNAVGPVPAGSAAPPPDIEINPVTNGAKDTIAAARHIADLGARVSNLMIQRPEGWESAVGATGMQIYSDSVAIVLNAGLLG